MSNAGFGLMTDFFGMASQYMKLISSDSGKFHRRQQVSHYGPYEALDVGPALLNPVCVYEVIKDTAVAFTLGKAWAAGYFLTSVAILTQPGHFPQVTLSGTANEGVDAINKWNVSVNVVARARAQNLLNALTDATRLQSVRLMAKCDPVVIYEDNEPSASDVVHGKLVLEATAVSGDGAATLAVANNNWTVVGLPVVGGGTDYSSVTLTAERSL